MDTLLQGINEIVLSHLRQQMQRIVAASYSSNPRATPTDKHAVLVPVDRVVRLVVVPSIQDDFVGFFAVAYVV